MRQLLPFLLLFLLFTSCKKETTLELNFMANYDGADLLLDEVTDYNYYDGTPLKISTFRFYISNITLVKGTEETVLVDVADIDFVENRDAASAAIPQKIVIENFETGSYDKIKFDIGVSESLNATTPIDYTSTHPLGLNNSGEYWESWVSYVFTKIEGRQDQDEDGTYNGFAYHVGGDQFFTTKEITRSIEIKEKKNNVIQFNIDAKKVFSDGTDQMDIVNEPSSHSDLNVPSQVTTATKIMNNFVNAITLN